MTTAADRPALPARVRIAIAGAGIIGTQHALVISELADQAELVAVVDPVGDSAARLAARYGGQAFATLGEALATGGIDVVSVCTPTGLHGAVALEALAAGRHVIVEKPAEVTLAKTDEIIAAQQRAGTQVMVISQHRFDRATEIAVDAIREGRLGRLTSGVASVDWWRGQSYYDSGAWRGTAELDGGGALMNQGVHTVDLLIATLGQPVEVFGYTATLAHERIETEDVAVAVVKFASGALGVLHATTAAFPGLSARLQVHGDRGSVVIENDELTFLHTTPAGEDRAELFFGSQENRVDQVATDASTAPSGAVGASDPSRLSSAHRRQYENFLAALRGEEPVRVGLSENRQSISLILGAYESARTHRPVTLASPLGSSSGG